MRCNVPRPNSAIRAETSVEPGKRETANPARRANRQKLGTTQAGPLGRQQVHRRRGKAGRTNGVQPAAWIGAATKTAWVRESEQTLRRKRGLDGGAVRFEGGAHIGVNCHAQRKHGVYAQCVPGHAEGKKDKCCVTSKTHNVRHPRRATGREAAFGTSARWRG